LNNANVQLTDKEKKAIIFSIVITMFLGA